VVPNLQKVTKKLQKSYKKVTKKLQKGWFGTTFLKVVEKN
jgi:hypothetical protein